MRILITNISLFGRTGTSTYVADLAGALKKRGHEPLVFTERLGNVALELSAAGINVTDILSKDTPQPDLIHGHHNLPTLKALLRFDSIPALFFCHDATAWFDAPFSSPRIRKFIAVDYNCRQRLLDSGIPAEQIAVVYNWVNTNRFVSRTALPQGPRKALLFTNYANKNSLLFNAVAKACEYSGVQLDVLGKGFRKITSRPETILGNYDLVFAKAKSAMEAMATGCAVVLCSTFAAGPLVTTDNFDTLRRLNFGEKTLSHTLSADHFIAELDQYDPSCAQQVSKRLRSEATLDLSVDQLLKLYQSALNESPAIQMNRNEEINMLKTHVAQLYTNLNFPQSLAMSPSLNRFIGRIWSLPLLRKVLEPIADRIQVSTVL